MKLRAKLVFAILALMSITFVVMALLLQTGHLSRLQSGRARIAQVVACALTGPSTEEGFSTVLEALARERYVTAWSLRRTGGKEGTVLLAGSGDLFSPPARVISPPRKTVSYSHQEEGGSQLEAIAVLGDPQVSVVGGEVGDLLAGMLFGAGLLAVVIYLMISRLVLAPLEEILLATHRVASGAIPPQVTLAGRYDEMGRLSVAFNDMAREVLEVRQTLEERVRQATQEVEATQKELAFSDRLAATGRLAAGIAHEINNPLGGVMNAVARLQKGGLSPEKAAEYLSLVEEGLMRMRTVVRQVLDFSHRKPEVADVDMLVPLAKAMGLCEHRMASMGITCNPSLSGDLPAVRADAGELQQVFLNLIANALDAMADSDGAVLTVRAASGNGEVFIEIQDTGVGMSQEELSASFDYFHTTKVPGEGTGLGLSIAHNIVTRYGGQLTLRSTPGEGTVARVLLPQAAADADPSARTPEAEESA